ncbi:MAG: alpha-amylase family glycosyl hydrolase [bacterium]
MHHLALAATLAPARRPRPGPGSAPRRIDAASVRHDTFDRARSPSGAVPAGTGAPAPPGGAGDLSGARVRLWDARLGQERFVDMVWDGEHDQSDQVDWWRADVDPGPTPTVLHYLFELTDEEAGCPTTRRWYVDDDPRFAGGGTGVVVDRFETRSFQITAHAAGFETPRWLQEAVIYQVFPDRFRDGDPSNNRPAGSFHYGGETIERSLGGGDWNVEVCDPAGRGGPPCPGKGSSDFFGGDLDGITQRIEDGFFARLGVTALYLNPVFAAPSNHRYDARDFERVDEDLGGEPAFARLLAAARAHGLHILLDGVFNHVSSDSRYFDRYGRYDDVGACEDAASPWRDWFYLPHVDRAASDGRARCAGDLTYEAWWGYSSLPKLRADHPEVRGLVYAGPAAVAPGRVAQGASGWRLDVGGDVDPGVSAPDNDFWEGFRAAVKAADPEAAIIGEEWGDASAWLLGGEWDAVMNYRLRSALLSFVFEGCEGPGCDGGGAFSDGDSNDGSASGAIRRIAPSILDGRLRALAEDYPAPAHAAMMNLLGSHDTSRIRFLLEHISRGDADRARDRLRLLVAFLAGYPGAPTLYQGDEVFIDAPSRFADGWHDDPYNRAPYPWPDTPGHYRADEGLAAQIRRLTSARHAVEALRTGAIEHGVVVDDARRVYGYARHSDAGAAWVLVNAGDEPATVALADGADLLDLVDGRAWPGGQVTVEPRSAALVAPPGLVDTPAAPVARLAGGQLSWDPVRRDTAGGPEVVVRYAIHRGEGRGVDAEPWAWVEVGLFGEARARRGASRRRLPGGGVEQRPRRGCRRPSSGGPEAGDAGASDAVAPDMAPRDLRRVGRDRARRRPRGGRRPPAPQDAGRVAIDAADAPAAYAVRAAAWPPQAEAGKSGCSPWR